MMENSRSDAYASAGVDITAGYKAVELMKRHIAKTVTPGVCSDVGGFGGLFIPDIAGMKQPVLVSGTDGVGTKLKLAFLADRHDTVGIDCVAMCVNDIVCCGAKPLFFLDYIACGKNEPARIADIVKGVADGCVQAGAALIGGETAEMPGFYPENEYDLAGFAVGIVDKEKILDIAAVRPGDAVIALPSSSVHSNGFSLVRKVFADAGTDLFAPVSSLGGKTLLDTLLKPTVIYVRPVLALLEQVPVGGISHITGGGFYENIPRSIPDGMCARIEKKNVRVPQIFRLIAETGKIAERDMYNTFNMGVGMTVTVPAPDADRALRILRENGTDAYILGEIVPGEEKVFLC
ncbi:MAG: phosphoribosylformylglycinamidine cyclo-ligase [Clostridia bacterium]|nr:phosphoribosylformylglycinamidine cyclo-ligase [Clostridia bacterium]